MGRGAVVGGLLGPGLVPGLVSVGSGSDAAVAAMQRVGSSVVRTLPVINGVVRDDATIRVRLHKTPDGRYRIVVCDPHKAWMRTTLKVT